MTGLILAKFRNAGQTCVAANRVSVHDSVYDTVCDKLVQRVSRLKVGHGIEDYNVDIGPLISKHGLDKVHAHVQESVKSGAKVLVGGKHHSKGGLFYEPTVLRDVSPNALIAREETFGPVAALIRFKTEEEGKSQCLAICFLSWSANVSSVISWANDTPSGLAGYFYSRDVSRIFRVAEALQVGMVGVNEGVIKLLLDFNCDCSFEAQLYSCNLN